MKKLLFFVLLLICGCSAFVEKPRVDLKEVRVAGVDGEGIDIDFLLSVTNPNSFDLTLNEYVYDLRLLALPLAHGSSQQPQRFPGQATTDTLVIAKVPYSSLIEIIKRRPGMTSIPYQLDADLKIGTSYGEFSVPVSKAGVLDVPEQYRPKNLLGRIQDFLKDIRNK
jgi:LEA14-like dessication related protein